MVSNYYLMMLYIERLLDSGRLILDSQQYNLKA